MQFFAFLDPEFWLLLLRQLWPVVAVIFFAGFAPGFYLGIRFNRWRLDRRWPNWRHRWR